MELKRITRHTLPTKYDIDSYGTICECFIDENKPRFYIQISENEEEPHWEPIGYVFEKVFESQINNDALVIALLNMIKNDTANFSILCNLLHK